MQIDFISEDMEWLWDIQLFQNKSCLSEVAEVSSWYVQHR